MTVTLLLVCELLWTPFYDYHSFKALALSWLSLLYGCHRQSETAG